MNVTYMSKIDFDSKPLIEPDYSYFWLRYEGGEFINVSVIIGILIIVLLCITEIILTKKILKGNIISTLISILIIILSTELFIQIVRKFNMVNIILNISYIFIGIILPIVVRIIVLTKMNLRKSDKKEGK